MVDIGPQIALLSDRFVNEWNSWLNPFSQWSMTPNVFRVRQVLLYKWVVKLKVNILTSLCVWFDSDLCLILPPPPAIHHPLFFKCYSAFAVVKQWYLMPLAGQVHRESGWYMEPGWALDKPCLPGPGTSAVVIQGQQWSIVRRLHDTPIYPFNKWLPEPQCRAESPVWADIRAFSLMNHI